MNMIGRIDRGLALGVGAYVSWGLLPLYLKLLHAVPPEQVLSHRVIWSMLMLAAIVLFLRRGVTVLSAARGRTLLLLSASAALIGINWMMYIWAVQHGHVLEASFGYFINPLLNVVLGVAVLGERVRPVQRFAVAIAAVAVVTLAILGGGALWISLILAVSFALYGLIRKIAAVDALSGLTIETFILAPFSIALLWRADTTGTAAFGHDARLDTLLIVAGAVTAAPLLMFAAAARRLRYSTLGLLQYIAPTLQFWLAVMVFSESLRTVQLVAFPLIWIGCAIYAWDSMRAMRDPIQV